MLSRLGLTETPIGSNRGEFVDSVNALFGLKAVPWCATTASSFLKLSNAAPQVWSPRALDFATGEKHTLLEVDQGEYRPKTGDFLVWSYGGGRGHIDFVIEYDPVTKAWIIVGANRSDAIKTAKATTNRLILGGAKFVVNVKHQKRLIPIEERGVASFYADKFEGRKTANGEIYTHNNLTAAHRTIPFGSVVAVTNLKNGRSVVVRINDRGLWEGDRIIDLSKSAADSIGVKLDSVKIEYVKLLRK